MSLINNEKKIITKTSLLKNKSTNENNLENDR